ALEAVTMGAQDYLVKNHIQDGVLDRSIRYSVERRRIQESLRQSEAKLAEAVRLARLGYWSRDLRTGRLDWSDLLYEIFDVAPSQFANQFDDFLALLHPDALPMIVKAAESAIESPGSFQHTYRVIVRQQVRYIHVVGHVVT